MSDHRWTDLELLSPTHVEAIRAALALGPARPPVENVVAELKRALDTIDALRARCRGRSAGLEEAARYVRDRPEVEHGKLVDGLYRLAEAEMEP